MLQVLKLELKEIREQQDLLFRFMNFLKQEGAVHVLQFCLTVGKSKLSPHPPVKVLTEMKSMNQGEVHTHIVVSGLYVLHACSEL